MKSATPSTALYRRSILVGCGLSVLLVVIALARMQGYALMAGVVAIAVLLLAVLAAIWLFFRNTRVQYEPGRVIRTDLLGRTRELDAGSVHQVLLVERLRGATQQAAPALFLLDSEGRTRLRLRAGLWSLDDMGAIGAAIPIDPDVIAPPITVAELRKRFPASVSLVEAHAVLAGVLAAGVVVATAAVGGLALW